MPTCSFVFDEVSAGPGPIHFIGIPIETKKPMMAITCGPQSPVFINVQVHLVSDIKELPVVQTSLSYKGFQLILFPLFQ